MTSSRSHLRATELLKRFVERPAEPNVAWPQAELNPHLGLLGEGAGEAIDELLIELVDLPGMSSSVHQFSLQNLIGEGLFVWIQGDGCPFSLHWHEDEGPNRYLPGGGTLPLDLYYFPEDGLPEQIERKFQIHVETSQGAQRDFSLMVKANLQMDIASLHSDGPLLLGKLYHHFGTVDLALDEPLVFILPLKNTGRQNLVLTLVQLPLWLAVFADNRAMGLGSELILSYGEQAALRFLVLRRQDTHGLLDDEVELTTNDYRSAFQVLQLRFLAHLVWARPQLVVGPETVLRSDRQLTKILSLRNEGDRAGSLYASFVPPGLSLYVPNRIPARDAQGPGEAFVVLVQDITRCAPISSEVRLLHRWQDEDQLLSVMLEAESPSSPNFPSLDFGFIQPGIDYEIELNLEEIPTMIWPLEILEDCLVFVSRNSLRSKAVLLVSPCSHWCGRQFSGTGALVMSMVSRRPAPINVSFEVSSPSLWHSEFRWRQPPGLGQQSWGDMTFENRGNGELFLEILGISEPFAWHGEKDLVLVPGQPQSCILLADLRDWRGLRLNGSLLIKGNHYPETYSISICDIPLLGYASTFCATCNMEAVAGETSCSMCERPLAGFTSAFSPFEGGGST